MFLIISSVAYITRLDIRPVSRWIQTFNNTGNVNSSSETASAQKHARLVHKVAMDYKLANECSELLVVCCVAYYLFVLANRCLTESSLASIGSSPTSINNDRQTRLGARLTRGLMKILNQAPELIIFTFTCLLIVLCLVLRYVLVWRQAEDFLVAIIVFLMPLKLLFFCRGSKSLGSFIVMIYKILVNDVLCFVVFLVIFIAGFSQCK